MGVVYATVAQFQAAGLPPGALQGISDAQILTALTNASAFIDSYLSTRFNLPLQSFGEDVTQKCIDIAAWKVLGRRGFAPGAGEATTLRMSFEDAERWLRDCAAGKASPSPRSVDATGFNPQGVVFSQAPQGGGISHSTTSDESGGTQFGTITSPKSRGW